MEKKIIENELKKDQQSLSLEKKNAMNNYNEK